MTTKIQITMSPEQFTQIGESLGVMDIPEKDKELFHLMKSITYFVFFSKDTKSELHGITVERIDE